MLCTSGEAQAAIRFANNGIIPGIEKRYTYLKVWKRVSTDFGNPPYSNYPEGCELGVLRYPGGVLTQETEAGEDQYIWVEFPDQYATEAYIYWKVYIDNFVYTLFRAAGGGGDENANASTNVRVSLPFSPVGFDNIGLWNWDLYSDEIWERDDTYVKKSLLDPAEDEEPPIHKPIELFLVPTIYDANRPERDRDGEIYEQADYVAEFHIKMNSILMEDLEGNGVEYNFEGNDSAGSAAKTADAFDSGYQADREYDFILDMDVGGDAGDMDDLDDAVLDLKNEVWKFKVTAKDNASAAGAGQTDNATEASGEEFVVADEDQIVSPKALWETTPTISGANVIAELKQGFGPVNDRAVSYEFETFPDNDDFASGWQSNDPEMFDTGGTSRLPNYYRGRMKTTSGEILSQWTEPFLLAAP